MKIKNLILKIIKFNNNHNIKKKNYYYKIKNYKKNYKKNNKINTFIK